MTHLDVSTTNHFLMNASPTNTWKIVCTTYSSVFWIRRAMLKLRGQWANNSRLYGSSRDGILKIIANARNFDTKEVRQMNTVVGKRKILKQLALTINERLEGILLRFSIFTATSFLKAKMQLQWFAYLTSNSRHLSLTSLRCVWDDTRNAINAHPQPHFCMQKGYF